MDKIKRKLTNGKSTTSLQQQKAIPAPGLQEWGAGSLVKPEEAAAQEQMDYLVGPARR